MNWRATRRVIAALALGAAVASCFDVPALPEAPACVLDTDCADGFFCNGAEVCVDGVCGPGAPCESFCIELEDGAGLCEDDLSEPEGPPPEAEPGPEPLPAPEPDGPEPDPIPEPLEPEPPQPEPEPGGRPCAIEGRPCAFDDQTPGECRDRQCRPIPCQDTSNCPLPACATCEGQCGLRADCASVTIQCDGPVGSRVQVECGSVSKAEECAIGGGERQHVACDVNQPSRVCCGDVAQRCRDVRQGVVIARLSVTPVGRWMCPDGDAADPICTHPGLLPLTDVAVDCDMDPLDLPGKR